MQRPNTSSSRVSKDHHVIDLSQHNTMHKGEPSSSSPRKRIDFTIDFPISGGGKIEHKIQNLRPKSSAKKWIYMIPLIVLLFFFILWYFSNPVDLEIEDLTSILPNEMPQFVNGTHVDHTVLAKDIPQNVSVSVMKLMANTTIWAQQQVELTE